LQRAKQYARPTFLLGSTVPAAATVVFRKKFNLQIGEMLAELPSTWLNATHSIVTQRPAIHNITNIISNLWQ